MDLGEPLLCLLWHTICLCSEPDRSKPLHPIHPISWRSIPTSVNLRPGLTSHPFFWGFPTKTLYVPLVSPTRATWPADLILFDMMTRIITNVAVQLFSQCTDWARRWMIEGFWIRASCTFTDRITRLAVYTSNINTLKSDSDGTFSLHLQGQAVQALNLKLMHIYCIYIFQVFGVIKPYTSSL
jgi:hypothetical protein